MILVSCMYLKSYFKIMTFKFVLYFVKKDTSLKNSLTAKSYILFGEWSNFTPNFRNSLETCKSLFDEVSKKCL